MEQRLQKILADMGIASRRKAEEMIMEGLVTVNGRSATIGMKADPARDAIKVSGKLLVRPEHKVYFAFHKPRGVVTTLVDPEGRPTVKDHLTGIRERVFPVGRLDYDSEGLLIITNDGDLAHAILHPSQKVPKTYRVKVKGIIAPEVIGKLKTGIRIDRVVTAPAEVRFVKKAEHNSWIEMTIFEGKKRQIRRMLEKVGHPVIRLIRLSIAGIQLGNMKPGELRRLLPQELRQIRKETGMESHRDSR